jgi:hypothetical protein
MRLDMRGVVSEPSFASSEGYHMYDHPQFPLICLTRNMDRPSSCLWTTAMGGQDAEEILDTLYSTMVLTIEGS